MLSNTKAKKMFAKLKTLEAENELLVKKNAELEKKINLNTGELLAMKEDIREISITEPIIK